MMTVHTVHGVALCLLSLAWTSLAQLNIAVDNAATSGPATLTPVVTSLDLDLRTGSGSPALPAGMTWHSSLTSSTTCTCDRRGVLKLSFSSTRKRAEIKLTYENSHDWTMNIGDSSTNDGYGGDSSTQQNDAEIFSLDNTLSFYGRDNPSGGTYGHLHSQSNYVGVQPYTTVTLNIQDELATADNGFQYLYVNSYKLFRLNGQADSGGVNRDVYLAMNRVVRTGSGRIGTGLCRVQVKFYPS